MDVHFKARSLWKTGKEAAVKCTKALAKGITFGELFSVYTSYIRLIVPSAIEHPVDCVVAFLLFHLYLLYVLIFSVSISVVKHFKTKGSGIAPTVGALKERAGVYLTYFFVAQSISRMTFGIPALDRVMGWAFQVKPQINFKPQIKIGKSKSNESVISVKSKTGTALHVELESEDEDTRKAIKGIGKVKKNIDFATEVADAMLMGQEDDGSEDNNWQDAKSSALLEEPNSVDSICLVQKWLENSESMNSEDVKKHVMKLVAENDQMRRESFIYKSN